MNELESEQRVVLRVPDYVKPNDILDIGCDTGRIYTVTRDGKTIRDVITISNVQLLIDRLKILANNDDPKSLWIEKMAAADELLGVYGMYLRVTPSFARLSDHLDIASAAVSIGTAMDIVNDEIGNTVVDLIRWLEKQ